LTKISTTKITGKRHKACWNFDNE